MIGLKMQLFLCYPDVNKSADSLDKARCWKQVLESKQILIAILELKQSPFYARTKNHPVAQAFYHFPGLVSDFGRACAETCVRKYKFNAEKVGKLIEWFDYLKLNDEFKPWFFGNEKYHIQIRANLLFKKPELYSKYGWSESPDQTRVYPGMLINEWITKK